MSFLNRCRGHSWCWAGNIKGCKGQCVSLPAGLDRVLPLSAGFFSLMLQWEHWGSGGRASQWNCALGWQLTKPVRARVVCTALVAAVFCIQKTNTALRVGSCDPAKAHYSLADSAQLVLNVKSTRFQQSCCERRVASTASHWSFVCGFLCPAGGAAFSFLNQIRNPVLVPSICSGPLFLSGSDTSQASLQVCIHASCFTEVHSKQVLHLTPI